MNPPGSSSRHAFLATVGRSRLLDPLLLVEGEETPEQLAQHWIANHQLTRFQTEKLLAGYWQGLIVGPYRLMYPLARGGVGIVYLARDDRRPSGGRTPRLLALKLLSPKRAREEPRTLARFQREMEIGRQIPIHPHLARTLEAGVADGVNYLAMEYVPGETVKRVVTERGPLAVPQAARVFADVAAGLHAAHQAGFVHRDTKPSNVILTPSGRGKLLDFGFALHRGDIPTADPTILGGKGYTVGTADYLPPEQASNAVAVGAETDIYSLGCSLYFAVTGRPPYPGADAREKIRLHQTAAPTSIRVLNPSVPPEFAALVLWLMAKRPEDRPQSAELVAAELERWARPVVPTADRLSYDDEWEMGVLRQVEAVWQTSRTETLVPDDPLRTPSTATDVPPVS
jgi:serine/threonine protein kinase